MNLLLKLVIFFAVLLTLAHQTNAQENTDSLLNVFNEKLSTAPTRMDSIVWMLDFSENLTNSTPQLGKKIGLDALQIALSTRNSNLTIRSLYVTSANYINLGNIDTAILLLNKAFKIIDSSKDSLHYIDVCNQYGRIYYRSQDNDSALYYYHEMLSIAKRTNNPVHKAAAYNNMGMVYSEQGKLKEAYMAYMDALKYYEETESLSNQAIALNNIALINHDLKQYKESISYFKRAIEINRKLENNYNLSMNYSNLGAIYKESGDFENAEQALKKSLEIATKSHLKQDVARSQMNLANLYKAMNRMELAKQYYVVSLENCVAEGLDFGVMLNNINLGELYLNLNNFSLAQEHLFTALQYAEKMQQLKMIHEIYGKLARTSEMKGDFKQALAYHRLHLSINDSLQKMSNRQFINDLQTKYETEKKEAENNFLKKENQNNIRTIRNQQITTIAIGFVLGLMILLTIVIFRSRKRIKKINERLNLLNNQVLLQNKQLAETNATKDKLFSLIAHDLKSPFSSMMGLLKFLIDEFELIEENERIKIFDSLYVQTTNTYALLENLLQWAMNQGGKVKFEPEEIDVAVLLAEETAFLQTRLDKKQISIVNQIESPLMVWGDYMMVKTILRNIINNSIKFSHHEGEIFLSSKKDKDYQIIIIEDKGIGMSEETIRALLTKSEFHSTPGTENEKGTGLGLVIVKDFIAINKATFHIESKLGEGSVFYIGFLTPDAR